jgi:hypothetical protein
MISSIFSQRRFWSKISFDLALKLARSLLQILRVICGGKNFPLRSPACGVNVELRCTVEPNLELLAFTA